MEVICKPKFNSIFWRDDFKDEWRNAKLDDVINKFEDNLTTSFRYGWPVKSEKTGDILYHTFFCQHCKNAVIVFDVNHGYKYCPYCYRRIVEEQE